MTTLRAAYVLDREAYELVYGPAERASVRELTADEPPVLTAADVLGGTAALRDVEVVLSGWGAPVMDERFFEQAPGVRTVLYGAGAVRGFVTDALLERGVSVSSAASANAVPVVDYTVSVVHLSLKRFWKLLRTPPTEAGPLLEGVAGAYGTEVGLLGVGEIGRQVCRRLAGSGLRLLVHDPYLPASEAELLGVEPVGLDELFARSEVVSLHAPLHDGTRGMITARHLSSMRPGATLLNTARGGLIRSPDLEEVLAERPDLQAVLDVTEPEPLPPDAPLLGLANVVVTPHIAGSMGRECRRMGALVVEELRRLTRGAPLEHAVDLSRLQLAATP